MTFMEGRGVRSLPAFRSSRTRHFIDLTKPRVMALAVFTAFVGMVIAPGELSVGQGLVSIAAIALGAGAAGALNMWYDAPIDALMARTSTRPIPAGIVTTNEALAFGLTLAVVSVGLLALSANLLAAAILAGTILFYSAAYTMWLKYATSQNIVIGGAAGALPPVIGWAAVTGSIDWQAGLLFLIVFLWTPPHFWALALLKSADYAAARIPMLPNVAGEVVTRRHIFAYAVLLAPIGVAPWAMGMAGVGYGVLAVVLGVELVRRAWAVLRTPVTTSRAPARALFAFSILYLYAIFTALLLDAAIKHVANLLAA
jgi:heme o synthase